MEPSILHKLLGFSTKYDGVIFTLTGGLCCHSLWKLGGTKQDIVECIRVKRFSQADEAQWLCVIAKG